MTYLEFELDSKSMTMHVPKTNVDKIKFENHQLISKKTATIPFRKLDWMSIWYGC